MPISPVSPSLNLPSTHDVDPLHSKIISTGKCLGQGWDGKVYEDKHNPGFVLKIFAGTARNALEKEVALFNCYYGENSATLINDETIRMKKISGIPLEVIEGKIFPENAIERFNEMICKLGDSKIMHNDFHPGNILYDYVTNTFNPIDFSNKYDLYFSESNEQSCFADVNDKKSAMNKIDENNYNDYITFIKKHMF